LSLDEEEAVQAELKALQEQTFLDDRLDQGISLPSVPNTEPVTNATPEHRVSEEVSGRRVAIPA